MGYFYFLKNMQIYTKNLSMFHGYLWITTVIYCEGWKYSIEEAKNQNTVKTRYNVQLN